MLDVPPGTKQMEKRSFSICFVSSLDFHYLCPMHKSGFVNIVGNPNAGKSTLMNALLGENLSITSPKAQTTRHRILGMLNEDDYQIVFSDTPGIVNPHYKLQESMLAAVEGCIEDADVFILISEMGEDFKNAEILERIKKTSTPILLLINKIDLSDQGATSEKIAYWEKQLPNAEVIPISALHKFNIDLVRERILHYLPEGPAYYPKDELSDKNLRFFASEIIREKILKHYQKEVPYSVEIAIESYQETPEIDRIAATIYVERESQKVILIGKRGLAIKRVGTEARKKLEQFLGKKVFLEMHVKVLKDWRNNERMLRQFGYEIRPNDND